jgi:hypothetical protein
MSVRTILGVIIGVTLVATLAITAPILQPKSTYALGREGGEGFHIHINPKSENAPVATSGDNIYVAWWTNKTANNNEEIMFRASTDGGVSFGDKINLSNTTNADSWRVEIDSDADSVVVTWWETNQTSDTPVMRVSTDNGATFGPTLKLSTNDTISGSSGAAG